MRSGGGGGQKKSSSDDRASGQFLPGKPWATGLAQLAGKHRACDQKESQQRTGRAEVVGHRIAPDLGVEGLDDGSHFDGIGKVRVTGGGRLVGELR